MPSTLAFKSPAPDALGEIVGGCAIAPDSVLLLGWLRGSLPEAAAATCESLLAKGRYGTFAWARDEASGTHWFLLVIRLADLAERGRGRMLLLHAPGSRAHHAARLPAEWMPATDFAARLAELLGTQAPRALDFLRASAAASDGSWSGALHAVIGELLRAAARRRGAIEIRGVIEGFGLFVQGWSATARQGRTQLLVEHDRIEAAEGHFLGFDRNDLEKPAAGLAGLVPLAAAPAAAVKRIWLRGEQGYEPLEVLAGGALLEPDKAIGHLRSVLPTLRGPAEVARMLRRAARPRFTGQDSLSGHAEPVRAAVDLAALWPGVGYYLAGWVLDPANRLAGVTLRGGSGAGHRLDPHWTRVPRPDVTSGFREDPRFAGLLGQDDLHGFTVFIPAPDADAAGRRHHLEFEFAGDDCAFLPLRVERADGPQMPRRLLESFDIHKPSAPEIVERHLGPLLRAGRRPLRPAADRPLVEADTVLLVPLLGKDPRRVTPFLAQFGMHRLDGATRMLIVCGGPADAAARRALERSAAFYGVDATLLGAPDACDAAMALQAGIAASASERLLFLSPSIFVESAGWIARLGAALAADAGAGAVSPTVLHEDFSIKFAGIEGVQALEGPPFAARRGRFAGYRRGGAGGRGAEPVLAGALECCLLRRDAVEAAGGLGGGTGLAATQALRLFLALRRSGFATLWTPEVEVYDLGDPAAQSGDYWLKTAGWVDGWCLRETWFREAARHAASQRDPSSLRTVA
mgnify:FL=1